MVSLLVALDVEQGVSVPKFRLALVAQGNGRRLTVPHEEVASPVIQVRLAVLPVPSRGARNARRTL